MRDEPSFQVFSDESTRIVEATMVGFWSLEVVTAFCRAEGDAKALLRRSGDWFAEIIDNTRFAVQSAEVSAALIGIVDPTRTERRAPTALIVSGGISRLQAARIGDAAHIRVVGSRAEALAWIASKAPPGWSPTGAVERGASHCASVFASTSAMSHPPLRTAVG